MDAETGSALQQLADTKLGGRLRERVEAMRRRGADSGWREIAAELSAETKLPIGKSTLHRWATEGGWDVTTAADRAAS